MPAIRRIAVAVACVLAFAALAAPTTATPTSPAATPSSGNTYLQDPWGCGVTAFDPYRPSHYPWLIWAQGFINCAQFKQLDLIVCLQWFDRVSQAWYNAACGGSSIWWDWAGAIAENGCFNGRFRTWAHGHAQWPDGSGAWSDAVATSPISIWC
jgi:hypothetical protein